MKKQLKAFPGDLLMGLLLDGDDAMKAEVKKEITDAIRIALHQNLSMKAEVIGCDTKHYISGIDKSTEEIYKVLETFKIVK